MNKNYWVKFYKTFNTYEPSTFSQFCLYYLRKEKKLIDIGCGNGRDSYFFAKNGFKVEGIDFAVKPKDKKNVTFKKCDFKNLDTEGRPIYARFFIHAISHKDMMKLFNMSESLLMLEFRNIGDFPKIYRNHKRNLIDGIETMSVLKNLGFNIIHFQLSRGLAAFKDENPLLCRIIARKES